MFQNLRKSKKLLLIAMTCATFAIAGCGSDTTKTTADNGTSVTWSETFDGTKNRLCRKICPNSCSVHVPSNNGNDVTIRP